MNIKTPQFFFLAIIFCLISCAYHTWNIEIPKDTKIQVKTSSVKDQGDSKRLQRGILFRYLNEQG